MTTIPLLNAKFNKIDATNPVEVMRTFADVVLEYLLANDIPPYSYGSFSPECLLTKQQFISYSILEYPPTESSPTRIIDIRARTHRIANVGSERALTGRLTVSPTGVLWGHYRILDGGGTSIEASQLYRGANDYMWSRWMEKKTIYYNAVETGNPPTNQFRIKNAIGNFFEKRVSPGKGSRNAVYWDAIAETLGVTAANGDDAPTDVQNKVFYELHAHHVADLLCKQEYYLADDDDVYLAGAVNYLRTLVARVTTA